MTDLLLKMFLIATTKGTNPNQLRACKIYEFTGEIYHTKMTYVQHEKTNSNFSNREKYGR